MTIPDFNQRFDAGLTQLRTIIQGVRRINPDASEAMQSGEVARIFYDAIGIRDVAVAAKIDGSAFDEGVRGIIVGVGKCMGAVRDGEGKR